jgi:hypothetical protein
LPSPTEEEDLGVREEKKEKKDSRREVLLLYVSERN